MTAAGRTMTTHVTLPLLALGAAGVKTAVDFEKSMNTMKAVAGVPGPELEKLRELAIKLGADTVFSANEAAAAMLELSKAGISTSDIMGGALANTLDLATAGDLELAEAATIAANAMNVFGLSGQKSKQAVDALAGAANASSADVSDLAQALAQGGLAAANAGLSIQETTAVLAAFADNGLKGSDAGTSLKTMLLSLVPTTTKAKEAMKELNIEFIDAEGNIKPIPAIFEEIQSKIGPLTQAQQQLALKTIFGTDAFRAASIALKLGSEGLGEYTAATDEAGTASKVAEGKMKGLPGVIERLKGTFETFLLTVGDDLAPVVEDLAKEIGKLLEAFNELPESTRQTILKFALLAVVAGPLLRIFGPLVSIVGKLGGAFIRLGGAAGSAAATSGFMAKLSVAMKGVANGSVTMGQALRSLFPLLSRLAGPLALAAIAVHDLHAAFKGFQDDGIVGWVDESISGWGSDLLKTVNPTAGAFADALHQIANGFRDINATAKPVDGDKLFPEVGKIADTLGLMKQWNVTLDKNQEDLFHAYMANKQYSSALSVLERALGTAGKSTKHYSGATRENATDAAYAAKQQRAQAEATTSAGTAADTSRKKTDDYSGAVKKIPPKAKTTIETNAEQAKHEVDLFNAALGLIDTTINVALNVVRSAIPGIARGTKDFQGGLALVGEQGPELAVLPKHSAVIPAHITRGILSSRAYQMPASASVNPTMSGGGFRSEVVPSQVSLEVDGVTILRNIESAAREQRITLGRRR